jgi:hypothetical protein
VKGPGQFEGLNLRGPAFAHAMFAVVAVIATLAGSVAPVFATDANVTVDFEVLSQVSLDTTGCVAPSFGSVVPDVPHRTGTCTIAWDTNAASSMLVTFQQDGAGRAMVAPGLSIPDYGEPGATWAGTAGLFGACLQGTAGAVQATWLAGSGCPTADDPAWRALPATLGPQSRIAHMDAPGSGSASLRFGTQVNAAQTPDNYQAQIVFQVIAPNVEPGQMPVAGTAQLTGTAAVGQVLTATATGTWYLGVPSGTISYQWRRCGTGGVVCEPIGGATGSTYQVTSDDIGRLVDVVITVTNACAVNCGSDSATSNRTSVVPGLPWATSSDASSGANSVTLGVPIGTLDGDVMVALIGHRNDTDPTVVAPAGWTQIRTTKFGGDVERVKMISYWRVASASEPPGYTWSWTANGRESMGVIVNLRGIDNTAPIDAWSENSNTTLPNRALGVTPTRANGYLLALYVNRNPVATWTAPVGMSILGQQTGNSDSGGMVAGQQLGAIASTGNRDTTPSSNDRWVAQQIALRPW